SPVLDGSSITAIEVAPADHHRVYAGTENGGFFRSLDGGLSWSEDLSGATLPGRTITRIEASPVDAELLFITVASFGNPHVFRSRDGGLSWEDVDRGLLPDAPHHAVAISWDQPQTVYVCSDAGVFVSPDLGGTWEDLTRNLPNVMVVDVVHHQATKSLFVATYGRSLWRLTLP
ncbi:MAG TPA: sialidase family protein, partial [Thermoanaerobaculia bacterium]